MSYFIDWSPVLVSRYADHNQIRLSIKMKRSHKKNFSNIPERIYIYFQVQKSSKYS